MNGWFQNKTLSEQSAFSNGNIRTNGILLFAILLVSALSRDKASLDINTIDHCCLAGLYLRANRDALASFEEDTLADLFEHVATWSSLVPTTRGSAPPTPSSAFATSGSSRAFDGAGVPRRRVRPHASCCCRRGVLPCGRGPDAREPHASHAHRPRTARRGEGRCLPRRDSRGLDE